MEKITERKITAAIKLLEAVSSEAAKVFTASTDKDERAWARKRFHTLQDAIGELVERKQQASDEESADAALRPASANRPVPAADAPAPEQPATPAGGGSPRGRTFGRPDRHGRTFG